MAVPEVGVSRPQQDADGGGFARAVRPQEAEDLALAHLKRDMVHGVKAPNVLTRSSTSTAQSSGYASFHSLPTFALANRGDEHVFERRRDPLKVAGNSGCAAVPAIRPVEKHVKRGAEGFHAETPGVSADAAEARAYRRSPRSRSRPFVPQHFGRVAADQLARCISPTRLQRSASSRYAVVMKMVMPSFSS